MEDVSERGQLVKVAIPARDEDQALFRLDQARMYASYHRSVRKLRSLVPIRRRVAVAARAADGRIVVAAPADYVALTRDLAETEIEARAGLPEGSRAAVRELQVAGGMSALARQWFEANGWSVKTGARQRLLPDAGSGGS
jgi:hypothetical protein